MNLNTFKIVSHTIQALIEQGGYDLNKIENAVRGWLGTCEVKATNKKSPLGETKLTPKRVKGSESLLVQASTAYRESYKLIETSVSSPGIFKYLHDNVRLWEELGVADGFTRFPAELNSWLVKFKVEQKPAQQPQGVTK